MPEDELFVRLTADGSGLKAAIDEASSQVRQYGTDTADAAKNASDSMSTGARETTRAVKDMEYTYDDATKAAVDHGKEIRNNMRDYRLASIEQVQYNMMLTMVGNTATQWGAKLQGANNIVNKGLTEMQNNLDKATGGFSTYFGAGLQLVGMGVQIYSQYARMTIMWGQHTIAMTASTAATQAQTVSTTELTAAQVGLNTAMLANPLFIGAAAVAVSAVAIYAAWNMYTKSADDAKKANDAFCKSMAQAATAMREQFAGQTGSTKDLEDQYKDRENAIKDLGEKEAAARKLGYAEMAEDYYNQALELSKQNEVLNEQITTSISKGPDYKEVSKAWGNFAKAAAGSYYTVLEAEFKANHSGIGPNNPFDDTNVKKLQAKAQQDGQRLADAYFQGIRDGFYSPENKAIIEDALKHGIALPTEAKSPPVSGPLKDIQKWGKNLMTAYSEGMEQATPRVSAASERVTGSIANKVTGGNNISNNVTHGPTSINITGMMDLSNPAVARMIAKTVDEQLKRRLLVS